MPAETSGAVEPGTVITGRIIRMRSALIAFVAVLAVTMSAFCADRSMARDGKHLFILSGQSNMRQPLPDAFKEYVTHVFGKDKVIVVTLGLPASRSSGGTRSGRHRKAKSTRSPRITGTLYDKLLKRVKRSIAGQQLASVTYIWMQGEADAGNGWGAVYEKSFYGILDQFKKDLDLKEIDFVIGRINDHWLTSRGVKDGDVVRAAQVRIGESCTNGDWVNTDDLNTGVNPWGIYETAGGHFPTPRTACWASGSPARRADWSIRMRKWMIAVPKRRSSNMPTTSRATRPSARRSAAQSLTQQAAAARGNWRRWWTASMAAPTPKTETGSPSRRRGRTLSWSWTWEKSKT